MALTQENRVLSIFTPLGEDVLFVHKMVVREALSEPFEIQAELLSADGEISFDDILGHNVTIRMEAGGESERHFNGYVSRFEQTGTMDAVESDQERHLTRYEATIVPWLWFLTRTADCRVFQDMTVPEIVKQVFRDHGFTDFDDALSEEYRKRTYCVQYRETDFAFVSRLLEQEGIYYFFEHAADKHTLVLADGYSSHEPVEGKAEVPFVADPRNARDEQYIDDWRVRQQVQPGGYMINDFNFRKPRGSLRFNAVVDRAHPFSKFEMYDYPAAFVNDGGADDADDKESDFAQQYSRTRIEEQQTQHEQITGRGVVRRLVAGRLFELIEHPRQDQNREYLLISTGYDVTNNLAGVDVGDSEAGVKVEFLAIDAQTPYRPARRTAWPHITGPQTAVVVGPGGEEIWTDQHGRVKVQFHWDRYGKADENSSCWIRVAQVWTGANWGAIFLPRIGEEVIVEFLEGDPDRPIVTGRVYNGRNRPPYDLPEHQTRSTLKSNTTKGGGGFNEIRFEDKKDSEQIFIHAQKDQHIRIQEEVREWVGKQRHLMVKEDQLEEVGGDKHLTVKGDQNEKIDGTVSQSIGMDLQQKVGMNHAVDAGMEIHLKSGVNLVIEAGASLTLKVGGNFVMLNPAGVMIQGTMVMINSGGSAGTGGGASPDSAEAPLAADEADAGDTAEAPAADPIKPPKPQKLGSTATALRSAADKGAPFCEKCEEAARASAASA